MTPRCEWLIVCERQYLDEQGRLCLVGLMNEIRAPHGEATASVPKMAVVAKVVGEPGQSIHSVLRCSDPDGTILIEMPSDTPAHGEDGTSIATWLLEGWTFGLGRHVFTLTSGAERLATVPVTVRAAEAHETDEDP